MEILAPPLHSMALSLAPGSRRAECDPSWLHQSGYHSQNSSWLACLCTVQSSSLSAGLLVLQISKACRSSVAPVCQEACHIIRNTSCFLSPDCPSWDTTEKSQTPVIFFFQGQSSLLLTPREAFSFQRQTQVTLWEKQACQGERPGGF